MFEGGTEEQYFQCNYIVYMSNFFIPEEINAACRKMTHMGKMDRDFSMLMILPVAPLENV